MRRGRKAFGKGGKNPSPGIMQPSAGGPNAPRLQPKDVAWFKRGEEAFTPEYLELSRDLAVCYDLVKLASHVLKNKAIRLKVGGEADGIVHAATDGKNIYLPKLHPQRRIAVKHEISHLYFKSNIPLRLLFVYDMIARIEKESKKQFDPHTKQQLVSDLCFVINIFDDVRVNSLWGLLYPGDGRDLEEWYQGNVAPRMFERARGDYPDGDIKNLFTYIILITLGQPAESKQWGEFKSDIENAAGQVYLKTFNAALLIVRELILSITRRVMETYKEPPPPQPQQQDANTGDALDGKDGGEEENPTDRPDDDPELQEAKSAAGGGDVTPDADLDQLMKSGIAKAKAPKPDAVTTLSRIVAAPRPDKDFEDDNAGFDFRQTPATSDPELALDMDDLQDLQERPLEDVLQELEQNAVDDVSNIQRALAENDTSTPGRNYANEGEWLRKSVKARVNIHQIKERDVRATAFSREDMEVALHWKKFFQRVLGSLAHRTEEAGYELLTDLYLQQKLGREPLDCFKVDTTGRGFRINLCIDMSGSMSERFPEVEKLARVLQIALNFPFVKLGVWGFNSKAAGEVDIYRFPPNAAGLRSSRATVEGVTPLSHAIQIVGRDLLGHRDDNHLFVLSDGFPVYMLDTGRSMATKALMNWTQDAVRDLHAQKVRVYCFMIGGSTPPEKSMDRMFGPGYWKNINDKDLYVKAFQLITSKFLQFLRAR